MPLKLAMAQIRVDGGSVGRNMERAENAIRSAAVQGAQLVVLPEALDCGWTHPSAQKEAGEIPGGTAFRRLAEAANGHAIHVCAGLTERSGSDIYNSAVLIGPDGKLLLVHRKINELNFAKSIYRTGDRLGVAVTVFGRVGLMICADAFVDGQVIARTLGVMGAEYIVSPCAWAVEGDHDNDRQPYGDLWKGAYGAVARDFRIWIAGVSNVGPISGGPWAGRKCIGASMLVGPAGTVVETGPYGEERLIVTTCGRTG